MHASVMLVSAFALFCLPRLVAAQGTTPTPTPTPMSEEDRALLRELEAATPARSPSSSSATSPVSTPAAASTGGLSVSNAFNPAMSVNGLFLASGNTREDLAVPLPEGEAPPGLTRGLTIQEIEMQFIANVDPYFSANLILALPGGEGIEVEEGYLIPTAQPFGFAARVGKMKAPFGRENALHTHALPFVDSSLVNEAIFGDEGLNEVGAEVSYLTPLPSYTLVTAALYEGANEGLFAGDDQEDLAGFGNVKNVFDLTSDATLETGVSWAGGNNVDGGLTQVAGGNVLFKWRPASAARTRGIALGGEVIYAHRASRTFAPGEPAARNVGGAFGYTQVKVAQRWHVGARFDYLGFPADDAGISRRGSGILVFAPTEFSALRLQASALQEAARLEKDDLIYEAHLQLNFTIGAHPAHQY